MSTNIEETNISRSIDRQAAYRVTLDYVIEKCKSQTSAGRSFVLSHSRSLTAKFKEASGKSGLFKNTPHLLG